MYADISQPPKPLPETRLHTIKPGVTLLPPLSRRGVGPGVILLVPDSETELSITDGVPAPSIKWAEEGYTVVTLQAAALRAHSIPDLLKLSVAALQSCLECLPKGKVGLIAYNSSLFNVVAPSLSSAAEIVGAAVYANTTDEACIASTVPIIRHLAGKKSAGTAKELTATDYYYGSVKSHLFATPFQDHFNYGAESVSHTRNLSFLKKLMDGPFFDLEAIWDEHTYYEFADRSVEHTMSTMVQEPYVNHVPTLTGGIGRSNLSTFYRNNFIFNNADDTDLELTSRTIGIDRIVDEFLFKFTHDKELDWLFPGVPPTHKYVELPFCAVVNIRGDRLYHEHISWDQAGALKQLGLLPEFLPFPYPLPDGKTASPGHEFYYRLPVAGIEAAEKMRDRSSVRSNQMFNYKVIEKPNSSRHEDS